MASLTEPPRTEPRHVHATCRFRAGPGREQEAAEAWAFELTYYFARAVGEAPVVTYESGLYTCHGLMTTTHFADSDPTDFTKDEPWDLDFCADPQRRERLWGLYAQRPHFDGRAQQDKPAGLREIWLQVISAADDPDEVIRVAAAAALASRARAGE